MGARDEVLAWDPCQEGRAWLERQPADASVEALLAACPDQSWAAWAALCAGLRWPAGLWARHEAALVAAVCRDPFQARLACQYWPDGRMARQEAAMV